MEKQKTLSHLQNFIHPENVKVRMNFPNEAPNQQMKVATSKQVTPESASPRLLSNILLLL